MIGQTVSHYRVLEELGGGQAFSGKTSALLFDAILHREPAASEIRERLGESLQSIQRFDAPIEQATTSSLEALKAFTQGNARRAEGVEPEAIPYYERAIELDPNFAMVHARLAVVHSNRDLGTRTCLRRSLGHPSHIGLALFEVRDDIQASMQRAVRGAHSDAALRDRPGLAEPVQRDVQLTSAAAGGEACTRKGP